jgi:proline iminopeptidase
MMKPESDLSNLNHYLVDAGDVRLSVYSTPQTDKAVLYCLHGGPGLDSLSLIPGLLPLSQLFDLRFVDLRGSGRSTAPQDGDYSLESTAKDIFTLIESEPSDREVGVLGHSFGSPIALKLLEKSERKLDFGIICSGIFDIGYQRDFDQAIQSANDSEIAEGQTAFNLETASDDDYRALMISLRSLYFPELPSEQSAGILASWSYRVEPYRYAVNHILSKLDQTRLVQAITCPVLIIGGTEDPVCTPRYLSKFNDLFQAGTLRLIEDAGHFPFQTQDKRFFSQVSQWWECNEGVVR